MAPEARPVHARGPPRISMTRMPQHAASVHPSSQLSAPATPALSATTAASTHVDDDAAGSLRCGVCDKVQGRFDHHCKTCLELVCSYIVCSQVENRGVPEDASCVCSRQCVLDYHSGLENAECQVPALKTGRTSMTRAQNRDPVVKLCRRPPGECSFLVYASHFLSEGRTGCEGRMPLHVIGTHC